MLIGEKIRKLREFREYSQDYVAKKLKMTQGGYSRMERGEIDIPFSRLEQVAEVLDMPVDKLIGYDDKQMMINYITNGNSNNFTTNGNILSNNLVVEELTKQYDLRILSLENEVIRLHSLLEKSLVR